MEPGSLIAAILAEYPKKIAFIASAMILLPIPFILVILLLFKTPYDARGRQAHFSALSIVFATMAIFATFIVFGFLESAIASLIRDVQGNDSFSTTNTTTPKADRKQLMFATVLGYLLVWVFLLGLGLAYWMFAKCWASRRQRMLWDDISAMSSEDERRALLVNQYVRQYGGYDCNSVPYPEPGPDAGTQSTPKAPAAAV